MDRSVLVGAAFAVAVAIVLGGCHEPLTLDGRACPCLPGWVCCAEINACLPPEAPCPPPDLSPRGPVFEPNPVSFGSTPIDRREERATALINDAATPATVGSLQLSGEAANDYAIIVDGCSGRTLEPHERCAVELRFIPSIAAPRPALLSASAGEVVATASLDGAGERLLSLRVTVQNSKSATVEAPGLVYTDGVGEAFYPAGTDLTMRAVAPSTEVFDGWSGAEGTAAPCTSENPCSFRIDTDIAVVANFHPLRSQLVLDTRGVDGASGAIDVSPHGAPCGAGCFEYDYDTMVRITATPSSGYYFSEWDQDCAPAGDELTCPLRLQGDSQLARAVFSPANIAFVTSLEYPVGDLGSSGSAQATANAHCKERALAAGLPGTFVAAIDVSNTTFPGAAGWVRVDGKPFLQSMLSGELGSVLYPLRLTESGAELTDTERVATGGTFNCGGWSSTSGYVTFGDPTAGDHHWLADFQTLCREQLHLYCLQTDYHVRLTWPRAEGRLAFVAGAVFPNGGTDITAADQLCNMKGRTLDPGRSWKALLATSTASAASRFDAMGAPWVRVDGIQLVEQAADLLSLTPRLLSALNVTEIGSRIPFDSAFTGAPTPTELGTMTCTDWSATSSLVTATAGRPARTNGRFFADGPELACTALAALYCLEE